MLSPSAIFKLAFLLMLIAFILGFISPFVPFVQRDIAVFTRAYFYPFWHCIEPTNSTTNAYCCQDNDFNVLSGGNKDCHNLIISAIAMDFVAVILALLTLIPIGITIFLIGRKHTPVTLAWLSCFFCFCVLAFSLAAWAIWITYAETTCVGGSIFPVQGYSYGFILVVFCSFFAFLGTFVCCLATLKLRSGTTYVLNDDDEKSVDVEAAAGVAYSYAPAPTPDVSTPSPDVHVLQYGPGYLAYPAVEQHL